MLKKDEKKRIGKETGGNFALRVLQRLSSAADPWYFSPATFFFPSFHSLSSAQGMTLVMPPRLRRGRFELQIEWWTWKTFRCPPEALRRTGSLDFVACGVVLNATLIGNFMRWCAKRLMAPMTIFCCARGRIYISSFEAMSELRCTSQS